MKKKISMLLIFTLLLITVTGCGSKKDKGGSSESGENAETISVQVETGWMEYYKEAVERVKET